MQGRREPPRKGVLPALLFVNTEGLRGEVVIVGCLDHSDHQGAVFQITGVWRKKTPGKICPWIWEEQILGC